jgi:tripartite-type tricarboxylate transporter receptor subunit TctC
MRHLLSATALSMTALLVVAAPARADEWPTRPIRLVVGFVPGGGTDVVARLIAGKMSETLKQTVVVENRAGASGTIGADYVAKSAPDGYTLLMGHSIANAIAPSVLPKVNYDPARDFTPVRYIGYVPNVLVVNPARVPVNSVPELVAMAKKEPGKLTYASSGIGSTQHLAGVLFDRITGTSMVHVPYKGSGQAVADLLAGNVDMNFDTMPSVLEHIRAGKLRALAISTPQRIASLPDVPTFDETGIRGFDVTNWYAVMAPKGMAPDVLKKLDEAVASAMTQSDTRARLVAQGVQFGGPDTPAAFGKFVSVEIGKYARMTKELKVRAE